MSGALPCPRFDLSVSWGLADGSGAWGGFLVVENSSEGDSLPTWIELS